MATWRPMPREAPMIRQTGLPIIYDNNIETLNSGGDGAFLFVGTYLHDAPYMSRLRVSPTEEVKIGHIVLIII